MAKKFKPVTTRSGKSKLKNPNFWFEQMLDLIMAVMFILVIMQKISSWVIIPAIIIWYIIYRLIKGNDNDKKV